VIVVVAPGQGSQTPGFLAPFLDLPGAADRLAMHSEASGVDLARHGTESDADTIRDTAVAQPLIVAGSLLSWNALIERVAPDGDVASRVGGVAGHSVGELAAAAMSGVLSEHEALRFTGERGRAMAAAAAEQATGMSAVIGADPAELEARLSELGLEAANHNGGGQVVVAGETDALARFAAEPPAKARVVPLQVAGAFHTRFMLPARARLSETIGAYHPSDPALPLWSNAAGQRVTTGTDVLRLLVGQVASPVRWDLCMEAFAAAGVRGLIELAPGGALTGLAKRGLKGVPAVAIRTPDDLDAAADLLESTAA
jgi:[acyl-carrier-protein] S-malonyltransferase